MWFLLAEEIALLGEKTCERDKRFWIGSYALSTLTYPCDMDNRIYNEWLLICYAANGRLP